MSLNFALIVYYVWNKLFKVAQSLSQFFYQVHFKLLLL